MKLVYKHCKYQKQKTMKKNNLFVAWLLTAVVAMLEFSSCSNEPAPEKPVREGMVDVVMTTSLPEVLQTYASNSAKSGLENLENQGLSLRYIMEVYTESGELLKRKMLYKPLSSSDFYRDAEFSARLFAGKYKFVFWADIVREVEKLPEGMELEGLSKPFYANAYFFSTQDENSDALWRPTSPTTAVKGDLQAIRASKIDESMAPVGPEMYDCYACVQEVDLTTEPTTQTFTLKRPFAKLRIITTGGGSTKRTPDYGKTVTMLKSGLSIPTMFNAKEHTYSKGDDQYGGYWATVRHQTGVYGNETQKDHTLGVFYLPVSGTPGSYNLEFYFDVYDGSGNVISKNVLVSVSNVPLRENYLTTIKGNLLANTHNIVIDIIDEFDDKYDIAADVNAED